MQGVVPLFKYDQSGVVVPVLDSRSGWVCDREGTAALITIKLLGIEVEVKNNLIMREWNGSMVSIAEAFPDDKPIFSALRNVQSTEKSPLRDGTYIVFGPDIDGNPMQVEENYMLCISPFISSNLIVLKAVTQLKFGVGVDPKTLYDSIQKEFELSPEIPGFVFLYEKAINQPLKWAAVDREDFGMPYPAIKAAVEVVVEA